ncbi:MAG: hypothetical protein D6781_08920, partial [Verrucomicrobia bacterium]
MKKLLTSTWTLAILALLAGMGTQAAVLMMKLGSIGEVHEEEPVDAEGKPIPEKIEWNFLTPEIERLQSELRLRLDEVAERQRELDEYALRLEAERAEIEKLKRDIEARREELAQSLFEVQAIEQKNLKTLAASYSNLSPEAALAIFQEMDDEMVVKILSFMKPDPVGQILEAMARTKDGEGTLAARAAVIT